MARSLLSILTSLAFFATPLLAQHVFYTIDFEVADPNKFIGLAGNMEIPPQASTGNYFLWPGLQSAGQSGVFQTVLDGNKGWWLSPGYCCNGECPA